MNALLNNAPLPQVLTCPPSRGPHRRSRIGNYRLNSLEIDHFNQLLSRLGQAPLECDQIASAARALLDNPQAASMPLCIQQRLGQAAVLARMLADHGWQSAAEATAPAQAVLGYLQDGHDLIPDWMPHVGRLDDAIVIEAAWPRLSAEVLDYQDFCRLRQIEAWLRGAQVPDFRFERKDWEAAQGAEAGLRAHQRRVRESSYLPTPSVLFRIH